MVQTLETNVTTNVQTFAYKINADKYTIVLQLIVMLNWEREKSCIPTPTASAGAVKYLCQGTCSNTKGLA